MLTQSTQLDSILSSLQNAQGDWVGLLELHQMSGSLAVHSRISDLRRLGHHIEQQTRKMPKGSGRGHSEYRLVAPNPAPAAQQERDLFSS